MRITKSDREKLGSRSYRCPSSSLQRLYLLSPLHFRCLQKLRYLYIYQLLRRGMALPMDHAGWCSYCTTSVERSSKRLPTVCQHTDIDLTCIVHPALKAGCKTCIEYCMGFLIILDFLNHYAHPPEYILCWFSLFICPNTRITYSP